MLVFQGCVGINIDKLEEVLLVYGNVKVIGWFVYFLDIRIKESIEEVMLIYLVFINFFSYVCIFFSFWFILDIFCLNFG